MNTQTQIYFVVQALDDECFLHIDQRGVAQWPSNVLSATFFNTEAVARAAGSNKFATYAAFKVRKVTLVLEG